MFLTNVEQMRTVEWGRNYQWDLKFLGNDIPSPFNEWFPATDVKFTVFNSTSHTIVGSIDSYKIPLSRQPKDVIIQFLDDRQFSLLNWFDNWVNNSMYRQGKSVATLSEAVKPLVIAQLDLDRTLIRYFKFLVYPEQSLSFHGGSVSSGSSIQDYTVNFTVAGTYKENVK